MALRAFGRRGQWAVRSETKNSHDKPSATLAFTESARLGQESGAERSCNTSAPQPEFMQEQKRAPAGGVIAAPPCATTSLAAARVESWAGRVPPTTPVAESCTRAADQAFAASVAGGTQAPVLPPPPSAGGGEAPLAAQHATQQTAGGVPCARLTLELPAAQCVLVCPRLPFAIEDSVDVVVKRTGAVAEPAGGVQVVGAWHRPSLGMTRPVVLVLANSVSAHGKGDSRQRGFAYVAFAEGPGSFKRCMEERWRLEEIAGAIVGPRWPEQLQAGIRLTLRRPSERVLVLRQPEEQLSRLMMQLGSEYGAELLAAPAGHGAVSLMATSNTSSPCLSVPQVLFDHLEFRFSVVFADVSDEGAVETRAVEKTPEVTLQKLLAFGVRHGLRGHGWLTVEWPQRLCLAEALGSGGTHCEQRLSLRVPCVDVSCRRVSVKHGRVVADIELQPAVRLVQPFTPYVVRNIVPKEGSAIQQTLVHVLPRLTCAESTHVWVDKFPPKNVLPDDLDSPKAFADYWRLIHGHHLPLQSLHSFARIVFKGRGEDVGLALTYPSACLWRSEWVIQPLQTQQHGRRIVQQALVSLQRCKLLGLASYINIPGQVPAPKHSMLSFAHLEAKFVPASRASAERVLGSEATVPEGNLTQAVCENRRGVRQSGTLAVSVCPKPQQQPHLMLRGEQAQADPKLASVQQGMIRRGKRKLLLPLQRPQEIQTCAVDEQPPKRCRHRQSGV